MLVTDSFELKIPASTIHISDRLGDTPRHLTWGKKGRFICQSNDDVDKLQSLLGSNPTARVHFLESRLSIAVTALITVIALLGFALLWGVPKASRSIAMKIPNQISDRVAQQTLTTIDKLFLSPSTLSTARQSELRNLLLQYDDFATHITFRSGSTTVGANAFALPAGYIVITDELVQLADSDAEIAAVYLHEVGHARGRHAEATVIQNSTWLVALAFLTGDVAGVSEALFLFPVFLGQMSFSRTLEQEADQYAISRLAAQELSPDLLANMLERLTDTEVNERNRPSQGNGKRWQEYFSTHPDTQERVKRIRTWKPEEQDAGY